MLVFGKQWSVPSEQILYSQGPQLHRESTKANNNQGSSRKASMVHYFFCSQNSNTWLPFLFPFQQKTLTRVLLTTPVTQRVRKGRGFCCSGYAYDSAWVAERDPTTCLLWH